MDKTEAVERLQLLIEEIDECELMALDVAAAEAGLEEAKNKHKVAKVEKQEKSYSNFEKWMMYLFPNY